MDFCFGNSVLEKAPKADTMDGKSRMFTAVRNLLKTGA